MWRLFGEGPMEKTKKNFGKTKKIIGKKQKNNGISNGILTAFEMVY